MAEITNKLLREAIADAEAVRETAVANAKLVLEESITPQIRDMIARRLRVEAENADADHGEEEEHEEEDTVDEATETPHEEGEAEGSSEMPADSSTVGQGDNKEPSDDAFDASDIGNGGENQEDNSTDWYDDWNESDFDLDEVIAELEADIANLQEEHEDDVSDEEEDAIDGAVDKHEKEMHEEEGEEEGEEGHLSQKDPHAHAKAGLKMDGTDADADHGDDEEELDLESILRELEADDEDEGEEPADDEHRRMADEMARLRAELAEYKKVVETLRGSLQEVNLLNAKLLFTNKMFRKDNLTNEQKIGIVESFDRATTVREVKLVYSALVENLSTAAKAVKNSRKKVVAEGFASKATPSTKPKSQEKEAIVENTVAKRLQQLAGIL